MCHSERGEGFAERRISHVSQTPDNARNGVAHHESQQRTEWFFLNSVFYPLAFILYPLFSLHF